MQKSFKYKITNGKLIEVKVIFDDVIRNVEILGDFFIYPSEGLVELERCIIGLAFDEKIIVRLLEKTVSDKKIELIGIDPQSIAYAVCQAIR